MDDYAKRLYAESYDKNMIDKDEYPETAAIEKHCTKMTLLWNAPGETIGTSTIGSSEACMLAGLAFAPLATRPQGKGSADRQAESHHEFCGPGCLGEVLQLLGSGTAVRADHA